MKNWRWYLKLKICVETIFVNHYRQSDLQTNCQDYHCLINVMWKQTNCQDYHCLIKIGNESYRALRRVRNWPFYYLRHPEARVFTQTVQVQDERYGSEVACHGNEAWKRWRAQNSTFTYDSSRNERRESNKITCNWGKCEQAPELNCDFSCTYVYIYIYIYFFFFFSYSLVSLIWQPVSVSLNDDSYESQEGQPERAHLCMKVTVVFRQWHSG